jgi:hypothetical protein
MQKQKQNCKLLYISHKSLYFYACFTSIIQTPKIVKFHPIPYRKDMVALEEKWQLQLVFAINF